MKSPILTYMLIIGLFQFSCTTDSDPNNQVSDFDGNKYETVVIGDQEWFAKNLRTSHYQNGTQIPNVPDDEWGSIRTGAWMYYDNLSSNDEIYGKLYNWFAVIDSRKICPQGWRVPSLEDWENLIEYVGENATGKLKASPPEWDGTDEFGFTALPAGIFGYDGNYNRIFRDLGLTTQWWSSSKQSEVHGYTMDLDRYSNNPNLRVAPGVFGYSVRCLRD